MGALDYESLWNKSRRFVRTALAARDEGRFDDFCFSCAVSLELLGKAMLSRVHPALVADPRHADSLFLACGKVFTQDPKTILAGTVFERISKLSREFDQTQVKFCMQMAGRRNADLHSGELPFEGLDPNSWAAHFWRAAKLMLDIHTVTLVDWVGDAEAARAVDLLNAAATVLDQAIDARIERCRREFSEAHQTPAGIRRIREQATGGRLVRMTEFGSYVGDIFQQETCPACGCDGLLSADKWAEDEGEIDEESGLEHVTVHYTSLAFRCGVCQLKLSGHDELSRAHIELEFEGEEEREIEYEDPYLNE
jgi:hypothetical protein